MDARTATEHFPGIGRYVEGLTEVPSDAEVREAIAGNLCRCTGYQNIVRAVQRAASVHVGEAVR